MPPFDFRSLSKRFAKVANNFREKASRQPLVQVTSQRIRALTDSRSRSIVRRTSKAALELYVAQAHIATGSVVADHIANTVQKRLARLAQTKTFETAKDPVEALHDFRVASRRLRAFVDVFEPLLDRDIGLRAKGPLQKITRAVRTVRDWDVQLGLLQVRLDRAMTEIERIALEDLLAAATTKRKREARRAHKRLRKVDFNEVHFAVCATLGATITHMPAPGSATAQLLWELIEPFVQTTSSARPPDDGLEHADWLHQFRIRLKKLRYALELFEPALGSAFGQLYAPVEELQELLGQHHDLVVLDELMERHRRDLEQENRGTLAHSLIALQDRLVEERQALVVRFRNEAFDADCWRQSLRCQLDIGTS